MSPKSPKTILDQILLLKSRGLVFEDEDMAFHYLSSVSYYRLKGYWWDMQSDKINHTFHIDSTFEMAVERYNFDRQLKFILFDAIERIEIALRTKMIYILSLSYGAYWYRDVNLFTNQNWFSKNLKSLEREYGYSQEVFIKEHKKNYPNMHPESWKILEVASMGTLSKFYKNLKHQLPEKAKIAKAMGLNSHKELSSWLEAMTYVRNIIAHHSRLWSRNMVKTPIDNLNNPPQLWLMNPLLKIQRKKPFLIISTMIYLCNFIAPDNTIKSDILHLFMKYPNVGIHKLGFVNNWENEPLWS